MLNNVPHLWVFAGPNGAGKSTLVAKYLRQRLPIVNPDVIAVGLGGGGPNTSAAIEAGKIAIRQRAALLEAGESFAIETTLSGKSEIRLLHDAGLAGYKVNLVYVGVKSAQVSERRVAHRVARGEHFVPNEDIVRRYPRSMENLSVAMRLADRTWIVDNTGRPFQLLMIREHGATKIVARMLPQWVLTAVPEELR